MKFRAAAFALNKEQTTRFVFAIRLRIAFLAALTAAADDFVRNALAHSVVENEILAAKFIFQALRFNLTDVFDDAAFKVKNFFEAAMQQVSARLFAANAARAVHNHRRLLFVFEHFSSYWQLLTKSVGRNFQRVFKMPDLVFVVITHINDDGFRTLGKFVKFFGVQIGGVDMGFWAVCALTMPLIGIALVWLGYRGMRWRETLNISSVLLLLLGLNSECCLEFQRRRKKMDFYFLLFSLFFPRIVLLAYFLMNRFPHNTFPLWLDAVMGVFIPRILILIFIYQDMGTNNIWFVAHFIAMFLTYFTGGRRTYTWRRRRREVDEL